MKQSSHPTKVSYPILDAAKFVLAFFVIAIHVRPLDNLHSPSADALISSLTAMAVPFFFTASGFLCFSRLHEGELASTGSKRAFAQARAVFFLYCVWTLIFLPITAYGNILRGYSFEDSIAYFVRGFLLVGENTWSWPLWYLLALAVSLGLIGILIKRRVSPIAIFASSAILIVVGFALNEAYAGAIALPRPLAFLVDSYFDIFITTRNGIFEGFFYVSCGMLIGLHKDSLRRIPFVILFLGAFFAYFLCLAITPSAQAPFCALFSTAIFLMCIRRTGSALPWLRSASSAIYLVHMIVFVIVLYGLLGHAGADIYGDDYSHMLVFVIVSAISTGIAACAIQLGKRYGIIRKIFHC